MIKVLMVCHGNICRSPMAEFVFLDLIKKRKIAHKFQVDSAGTSTEELGNPVHPGTVKKLHSENIPMTPRRAVQLKKKDYQNYDWLLCMDEMNVKNTLKIVGSDPENKIYKLLDFSESARDIADPWYTGNFDQTFDDILEGCEGFFDLFNRKQENVNPYITIIKINRDIYFFADHFIEDRIFTWYNFIRWIGGSNASKFFVYMEMYYFLMAGNLFLKHKVKHVYFYALILLIPYLLVPFIGQVPALILIKIIFIIVYKTRGNSWIRTLASYLLPITITNLVQSLISLTPLLNKDNPGVNLSLVLPIIISFSFAYLFMKALIYCYHKYKHKIEGLYKNIYFKVAIAFFIVGIIFLEIYGNIIIKKYLQLKQYLPPALIFFIYLVFLTLTMLSIAYAGIHAARKKEKEKQYRELEGYTSHLEGLHKNISGFKHDYVNILSSLMGYIESEDYKGLKNHLTQVIAPYSQQIMVENQSFSALMMVKIPALKGLLTVKLLEIYRLELNHRVEIIEPVETIPMDLVDLSRMLGILLDNAIEAAALSQEKHLGLALIKSPQGLTIIVENTCPEDLLPIHEMYEERKSTKGPSRGLGLYHYKAMAKAYSHVLTETFIENKVFKQVLTIGSE